MEEVQFSGAAESCGRRVLLKVEAAAVKVGQLNVFETDWLTDWLIQTGWLALRLAD